MNGQPRQISDAQFEAEVLQADLPVLVDFWAPWCGPCRMVAPVLEKLAADFAGRLAIAKVNTDENQLNAYRLGVQGIPTLVLFRDGVEVDRLVGALPRAALTQWLDQRLGEPAVRTAERRA